jgi:hypothetical protein
LYAKFLFISDETPETPSQMEVFSSRTVSGIYQEGLQLMAERVIFPLHISLYQVPLDHHGMPVAALVTASDDGSYWRRAAYRGVMLNVNDERSRSLHVKIHSAFSGEIQFVLTVNKGDQFIFTLKVHDHVC